MSVFFGRWVARQPLWVRIVINWTIAAVLIYIGIRTTFWWILVGIVALTAPWWSRLGKKDDDAAD